VCSGNSHALIILANQREFPELVNLFVTMTNGAYTVHTPFSFNHMRI